MFPKAPSCRQKRICHSELNNLPPSKKILSFSPVQSYELISTTHSSENECALDLPVEAYYQMDFENPACNLLPNQLNSHKRRRDIFPLSNQSTFDCPKRRELSLNSFFAVQPAPTEQSFVPETPLVAETPFVPESPAHKNPVLPDNGEHWLVPQSSCQAIVPFAFADDMENSFDKLRQTYYRSSMQAACNAMMSSSGAFLDRFICKPGNVFGTTTDSSPIEENIDMDSSEA